MHKIIKLAVVTLAICLAMTTCQIAYADQEGSVGITNLYNSISLNVDTEQQITIEQFCDILTKFREDCIVSDRIGVAGCYDSGWINMYEAADPNKKMTVGDFYRIVFNSHNIIRYTDPDLNSTNIELAILNGLCNADTDPEQPISLKEALVKLYLYDYSNVSTDIPYEVEQYNITLEHIGYNYKWVINELHKVPEQILNEFEERDWEFVIGYSRIMEYVGHTGVPAKISGLTEYREETISVTSPASVIHEFGHFLHMLIDFDYRMFNLWQAEGKDPGLIGEYATTNEYEYFAEFFQQYVYSKNNTGLRDRLISKAPNTFKYFENLEQNNWGLE